jgi:3-oxoacyl-[acyl-carrier protein] reductase
MNLDLEGRRALVTGSSSGIGAAIAVAFAGEGVSVAVHGRDAERVGQVVEEIRERGGNACACVGDLTDRSAAEEVIESVERELGTVDILVNNAGTYDLDVDWFTPSPEEWLRRFDENTVSAVRLLRRFVPSMIEAGWGRVINISSTAALMPPPSIADYAASKAALTNMTLGLARRCFGTGVTANNLVPGSVLTDGMRTALAPIAADRGWADDPEVVATKGLVEVHEDPPGGWGLPEDVAYAALWLASPRARWITGSSVRMDGGEVGTY